MRHLLILNNQYLLSNVTVVNITDYFFIIKIQILYSFNGKGFP